MGSHRTNRRPAPCAKCKSSVGADLGTLLGPPWRVICKACLPFPSTDDPDAVCVIRVAPAGDGQVELVPAGRLGIERWATYREVLERVGIRPRKDALGAWHHCTRTVRVAETVLALTESGFVVDVDPRVTDELQHQAGVAQVEVAAAVERTAAVDAILAKNGGALYPFQKAGVAWLAPRQAALLSDDMGLGKTIQVLAAAPSEVPVLVVCPAVAKGVWLREAAKWRPDLKVTVLSGRGSFRWPLPGELVVTNYDILPGTKSPDSGKGRPAVLPPELATAPAGCVVVADEAHNLKSSDAIRTARFRALSQAAMKVGGRTWLLTATPLLNRPPELWAVLQAAGLAVEAFGSYGLFMDRFNAYRGRYGTVWGQASPAVAGHLQKVMLRRTKVEVLLDLPAKRIETVEVNGLSAATKKLCDAALAALAARGIDLDKAVKQAKDSVGGVSFTEMSAARAALASAKLDAALELVESYEEAGEPLVVFSAHRGPIDALAEREGWAAITGETPGEERTRIEASFQRGELRGVCCTIKAGGVAITLTRAAHALFIDEEWTPALNSQAQDRIYRIGQERPVVITRLVAAHALDWQIAELLGTKDVLVGGSIEAARRGADDELAGPAEQVNDALAAIAGAAHRAQLAAAAEAERQAAVAALLALIESDEAAQAERDRVEADAARDPAVKLERYISNAGKRLRAARKVDDTLRLARTPREEWAAAGLGHLAANDTDHAMEENFVGFSKAHTGLGHCLAREAVTVGLTNDEWKLACYIATIYKGQVGDPPAGEEVL